MNCCKKREVSTRVMNIWIFILFYIIFLINSLIFIVGLYILYFFPDCGKIWYFLHLWNIHFLVCKQNLGVGMNTLMSISDGLGPSVFCRKMRRTRSMREEMDGKVVYFPPASAFQSFDVFILKVLFSICTLTRRVNNYVSRRGKV